MKINREIKLQTAEMKFSRHGYIQRPST